MCFIPVIVQSETKLNLGEKSGRNTERYTPMKITSNTKQKYNDINANPFKMYSKFEFL